MNIMTVSSDLDDTVLACADVMQALTFKPQLVIVGFNTHHDGALLQHQLAALDCPIMAGSSCLGALAIQQRTDAQLQTQAQAGLVLWALQDVHGSYGVGYCEQGDAPRQAAQQALEMALQQSGRDCESPALLWCVLPPGEEEQILQGFADIVGPNVPVLGGSSADNDVSGQWQQFNQQCCGHQLIQVAVFFPSAGLGLSFSSGYQPSGQQVKATQVQQRQLLELDGIAAAQRFNQLTGGSIQSQLQGGNVLALTTLHPLGRRIADDAGTEEFLLSHPDAVTHDGGLSLFSEVEQGETLELMTGSIEGLVQRGERVLQNAIAMLPSGQQPMGALMIYCAGCMLTIGDQVQAMARHMAASTDIPIMGLYTFGEQGCFVDGQSRHGNLMISAVVFGQ